MTSTMSAPAGATTATGDPYVLISGDCHAGGNHEMYRGYLERGYHDDFDRWRAKYTNPFRDLTTGTRDRNWDDGRRIREMEADGCVAEVVYPNTIPPFFPTGAVVARPPRPDEYDLRLAGLRAHNRWLADWCAGHPERRAGIGQVFLNDLDDAVADVRWCAEHGLRGGVLLPGVPDDMDHLVPLFAPELDPLWAACEELGVVVNVHSGGSGIPDYGPYAAAGQVWLVESQFFSRRALSHLLLGRVFERFPGLRFVVAEQGASWIRPLLDQLDGYHELIRTTGRVGELKYAPEDVPPLRPSEYFATNCWVTASFPSPTEAESRHALGVDRFLWGSDYPHDEGSYPHTREALRRSFAGATEDELRLVLGGNAAALYGFDLDALRPLAAAAGPTVAELAEPYAGIPEGNYSPAFTRP